MGFAQAGTAIHDGDNLAIAGVKPSGLAAKGQVFWRALPNWVLLNHVEAAPTSAPTTGATTAAIDTTGASLLVAISSYYQNSTIVTDNQSNAWTTGAISIETSGVTTKIDFVLNPATSTAHVFTTTGQGNPQASAFSFIVLVFKGTPSILDQSSQAVISSGTTLQATLTPTANSSLILTSVASNGGNLQSIDSGFTMIGKPAIPGLTLASAAAYLAQSKAMTVSPTWTSAASSAKAAAMISFKPSP